MPPKLRREEAFTSKTRLILPSSPPLSSPRSHVTTLTIPTDGIPCEVPLILARHRLFTEGRFGPVQRARRRADRRRSRMAETSRSIGESSVGIDVERGERDVREQIDHLQSCISRVRELVGRGGEAFERLEETLIKTRRVGVDDSRVGEANSFNSESLNVGTEESAAGMSDVSTDACSLGEVSSWNSTTVNVDVEGSEPFADPDGRKWARGLDLRRSPKQSKLKST